MGSTHFLTRALPNVSAEMGLHVLAYNLKRAMRLFGTQPLMEMMRAQTKQPHALPGAKTRFLAKMV